MEFLPFRFFFLFFFDSRKKVPILTKDIDSDQEENYAWKLLLYIPLPYYLLNKATQDEHEPGE